LIHHLKAQQDLALEERNKQEAKKQREIHKIIKEEQKHEVDKNLNVFVNLNNEEKILRQELVQKQTEL
jgi:hypothetical protein